MRNLGVSKELEPPGAPDMPDEPPSRPASDQAALAGGALAAVLAIAQADGKWDSFDSTLGLTIFLVMVTFYRAPTSLQGNHWLLERAALSAVLATIFCVVAGIAVEWIFNRHPNAALAALWAILSVSFWWASPKLVSWHRDFISKPPHQSSP